MARIYTFYSPLPPEQVPGVLPGERKEYGWPPDAEASIRTKWRGRRLTVTRTTTRRYTAADGWVLAVRGAGWTWGPRIDREWNNPFCGEVRPDGRGGSVLTGRFRIHPAGRLLFAVLPPVIVYSLCFLSPRGMGTLAAAGLAAALYLRHLIHACRGIDSYPGVEEILRFLREHFEEVEE